MKRTRHNRQNLPRRTWLPSAVPCALLPPLLPLFPPAQFRSQSGTKRNEKGGGCKNCGLEYQRLTTYGRSTSFRFSHELRGCLRYSAASVSSCSIPLPKTEQKGRGVQNWHIEYQRLTTFRNRPLFGFRSHFSIRSLRPLAAIIECVRPYPTSFDPIRYRSTSVFISVRSNEKRETRNSTASIRGSNQKPETRNQKLRDSARQSPVKLSKTR
jgi:hypothetical protein